MHVTRWSIFPVDVRYTSSIARCIPWDHEVYRFQLGEKKIEQNPIFSNPS